MEIYLNNLTDNYNKIKSKTNKEIIAVVKNNAYGLGLIEISKKLVSLGVKMLAVNDIIEAVKLRENFIYSDVLILNSLTFDDYSYLYRYDNIVLSINSLEDAINLNKYYYGRPLRVHIQIDSGMNRLGIKSWGEYLDTLNIVKNNEKFHLEGIYTHFVSSKDSIINNQISYFKKHLNEYHYRYIHIMNSSSIDKCDFGNLVRVGIALYGVLPDHKQVVKIKTKPIWIKKIYPNETIGYEQKYQVTKESLIALLPIGYGNGIIRAFEGFSVLANNQKYPIIGHICMNHMFVLVDESINQNTHFYITNDTLRIEELANYINTCPHQIQCMFQIENKKYL